MYAQGIPCAYEDSRENPNTSKQNTKSSLAKATADITYLRLRRANCNPLAH
jgi:hypothetical protein